MSKNLLTIQKILSEKFGISEDLSTPTANFSSDLNLSQIEIMDLISIITDKFSLMLPEDIDFSTLKTVSDIINLIELYGEEI